MCMYNMLEIYFYNIYYIVQFISLNLLGKYNIVYLFVIMVIVIFNVGYKIYIKEVFCFKEKENVLFKFFFFYQKDLMQWIY